MTSWKLDNSHSEIQFSARHMMISKVRGQFEKFEGDFNLDETTPTNSKVEVRIDAASINTRFEQRDVHLRSADFLDAEQYPHLVFRSSGVEVTSPTTALLKGNLTIRDISKPVEVEVEFVGKAKSPWGTTSYGFTGHTVLNRKEWNLMWNVGLETGGVLVGDEITVNIELELVQVEEPQTSQGATA